MKKFALVLLLVLSFSAVAGAQEFPNEPYEFLLGKLAAASGDFDEALRHLDRAIGKNASDPVLMYERAMIYIDAGRVDRAESELRAVLAKSPDFYDANRVLGRVLLDRSNGDHARMEEALTYLEAAYKASPDDISTGVAVSQILTTLGRQEDAARVLSTLVERAPDGRSLNFAYAQVLTKVGRGSESRKYLERAVAADPTFGPAIMQLLDLYQQESEWKKAADLLEPLIAEDPLNLEMQRQQAYFLLRAGDSRNARDRFKSLVAADPKDTRSQFYLAEALNDLEEYAESEKIYRQLSAADPNDADYLASLGLSLGGQKKWEDATATFNHLLRLPNVPDNLVTLANTQLAFIELQRGNHAKSVDLAKSALTFRDKPNNQAINIAVEALKKDKKYAEAVTLLDGLVTKFANDPFVNAKYVEALVRAGQKDKARAHALTQAKVGPRNAMAAAEAYVQLQDHSDAITLMKAAVAERPDDIDLLFELGSVYERASDRKAAEGIFLKVLETTPDHAPSLNYLGYMWAEGGENLDRAQEMLTRAVGQDPNNGAYIDSLGWVYFQLGKLELAEKYLTDAAKLLPRDATVHEHLGDVLAKRGEMPRALELYRAAVDLDPESKEVPKLRSKISEIERRGPSAQR
jgi:tetratricopeptide (TPR) repeat protein